jgi:hypothetical protein
MNSNITAAIRWAVMYNSLYKIALNGIGNIHLCRKLFNVNPVYDSILFIMTDEQQDVAFHGITSDMKLKSNFLMQ